MAPMGDLNRRELFVAGGRVAATGGVLWLTGSVAHAQQTQAAETATGLVTVSEGTNISAAASPDQRWVAIDLYTAIWLLPAVGGEARRVTDDLQDASRPQFSPDSDRIVFQAYRDGNYHLWLIGVDGEGLRQFTTGRYDHREPRFSPDGRRIAFSSDRGGSYGIWIYDLDSAQIFPATDSGVDEAEPSWSPDGRKLMFTVDGEAVDEIILGGARRTVVEPAEDTSVFAPSYAPDGRVVSYTRLRGPDCDLVVGPEAITSGEDVFPFGAQWLGPQQILYTADGTVRTLDVHSGQHKDVPFTAQVRYRRHQDLPAPRDPDSTQRHQARGIAGPVLSPNGTHVAYRALGALWVQPLHGRPHDVVADAHFNSDPDWFPDGDALVYSSDRSGAPALWRHDLATGQNTRLAELPGAQVAPRCSPDGTQVAYQDQDGATWVLNLTDRHTRKVLPALFQPGRPSWSPDGRTLALAAVKPMSKRFREGTSQILTVDLTDGAIRYTEPMPFASLSTRGDDGPLWSPDGRKMAFVVSSLLYVVDVDSHGQFTDEPRQITNEVTDSPCWSPDSHTLLYLSNGKLRMVPAEGGPPRGVDVPLTWTRSRPTGRTVIRAGALWDGDSHELRRDVDIVIEGNRITAVEPRDENRAGTVVDASGLTVMPGLIDAHNHWHLRGKYWGSRQGRLWLSYGITTTRSPGDPAYQMLETREALDSGAILGPRYVATGEAIDGGRVYYNFMRPTSGPDALRRELERAAGLEYDLIKTYVRLPVQMQQAAISLAHQQGRPLSSHYLYPAVNLGMDGMEHTGATNRLGYSHTVSRLGRSYGDAVELLARSGMSITPTLFNSKALYGTDRSLVEDRRTRTLFPEWEYQQLLGKAEAAASPTPSAEYTRQALAANVSMLLRIHRAGGFVIAGTDAPLDDIAISLHQNLRAMVQHGFTPYEALVIASRNPARWLGLGHRLGLVRPGMLADLVAVEGDPLHDIRAAAAVRFVVANGVPHSIDDLIAAPKPREGGSSGEDGSQPHAGPKEPKTAIGAPMPSADSKRFWWHGEPEWAMHLCC